MCGKRGQNSNVSTDKVTFPVCRRIRSEFQFWKDKVRINVWKHKIRIPIFRPIRQQLQYLEG